MGILEILLVAIPLAVRAGVSIYNTVKNKETSRQAKLRDITADAFEAVEGFADSGLLGNATAKFERYVNVAKSLAHALGLGKLGEKELEYVRQRAQLLAAAKKAAQGAVLKR